MTATPADYLDEHDVHVAAILPPQAELVADDEHRFLGFVAGLGSGKTRAAVYKALQLGAANPGLPGLFVEPVYAMVEDVAIAMFLEVFDEWGMEEDRDYVLHRRPPQSLDVRLNDVEFSILFRSSDNPRRLVGSNVAWCILDEADDHKEASAKALAARVRHPKANLRQFVAVGTPESMGGWFQRWFETEPKPKTRLIRASTLQNHFLPADYVELNLGHLSDDERRRYVEGEFVAPGGRVYTCYDHRLHEQPCTDPRRGEPVMACDFGAGCMAWIMGTQIDERVHFHGEQVLESADTIIASKKAAQWWSDWFLRFHNVEMTPFEAASQVSVYCDPAGGKTFGKTDVSIMREQGFNVYHRKFHPRIRDRINSVQKKLDAGELFVDPDGCPYLIKCFRGHSYDPNTGMPTKARPREGKAGLDHGVDAVGYLIEYLWRAAATRGNSYHY